MTDVPVHPDLLKDYCPTHVFLFRPGGTCPICEALASTSTHETAHEDGEPTA